MKLKRHIDMPNNRRMRLRYFPKSFHHAIMVTKFPQNVWFFFPLWALRLLVKLGHEFTDIGVCDDASITGMGGYNDYFFSSSQYFFSSSIFHKYIPASAKEV